jgi:hypothetical protein
MKAERHADGPGETGRSPNGPGHFIYMGVIYMGVREGTKVSFALFIVPLQLIEPTAGYEDFRPG